MVGITQDPPRLSKRYQQRVQVPYDLAKVIWLMPGSVGDIVVAWHGPNDMNLVYSQLQAALDRLVGPDSYSLTSTQFMLERGKKIVNNFIAVGATQAFFCILIASIGIFNVMLANVVRRSHEFALRVAMGARVSEVFMLILGESLFLGLVGAMFGVAASVAAAPHVSGLFAMHIPEAASLRPIYSIQGAVLPLVVCGACGLLAGVIPALKVRRLDILALLRREG